MRLRALPCASMRAACHAPTPPLPLARRSPSPAQGHAVGRLGGQGAPPGHLRPGRGALSRPQAAGPGRCSRRPPRLPHRRLHLPRRREQAFPQPNHDLAAIGVGTPPQGAPYPLSGQPRALPHGSPEPSYPFPEPLYPHFRSRSTARSCRWAPKPSSPTPDSRLTLLRWQPPSLCRRRRHR